VAKYGIQFPTSMKGFNFSPLSNTAVFSVISHADQGPDRTDDVGWPGQRSGPGGAHRPAAPRDARHTVAAGIATAGLEVAGEPMPLRSPESV